MCPYFRVSDKTTGSPPMRWLYQKDLNSEHGTEFPFSNLATGAPETMSVSKNKTMHFSLNKVYLPIYKLFSVKLTSNLNKIAYFSKPLTNSSISSQYASASYHDSMLNFTAVLEHSHTQRMAPSSLVGVLSKLSLSLLFTLSLILILRASQQAALADKNSQHK